MSTTIEIPPGECIDPYLREFREPGTTFVLGVGEYTTRGCFDFPEHDLCMLAPGTRLEGAGINSTILNGTDPVLEHEGKPTGYAEILTGGARTTGYSSSIVVKGLSIIAPSDITGVGLHLWTTQAVVEDVVVYNIFGDRNASSPVKEGFGILVNNSAELGGVDGGHRVLNCKVQLAYSDEENYATAIFVGCVSRGPLLRSYIENCIVLAKDAHAGYAFNDRTTIKDCEVVGCRRAVFVDTGPVRDSHIQGLDASRVAWALDLRGVGERRGITLTDSTFDFRALDGWAQGILVSDDESGAAANGIHVAGCTFLAPAEGRASKARLRGKRVGDFTESGNLWVGGWEAPVIQNRV
jgi:hypothetical protein